jgi:predicted esterase
VKLKIESSRQLPVLMEGDFGSEMVQDVVIALHGYGESAAHMVDRLQPLLGLESLLLISLEAPHPIYLANGQTGSSWLTSYRRHETIFNNMLHVKACLEHLRGRLSWQRLHWLGYSQGAQMAMRAALWLEAHSLMAIGAEIPPELKVLPQDLKEALEERFGPGFGASHSEQPLKVALMRAKKDMAVSHEVFSENASWLEAQGFDLSTRQWSGGHRWNEDATEHVLAMLMEWRAQSSL